MQIVMSGLLLVISAGVCWIGIGVSVSRCTARHWDYNIVQGLSYFFSCMMCLLFLFSGVLKNTSYHPCLPYVLILSCLAGIINFFTYVLTAKAMELGPHGLVWGIMQSGMTGSFLMGVCFFGEKATLLRLAGLFLIIGGVLAMGAGKDGKQQKYGKKWLLPSLGAFLLVMLTHCCNALPSFFPEMAKVGSVYRTLGMYAGGIAGFLIMTLPGLIRKRNYGTKGEWGMAVILMLLNVSASVFLFYNGLNLLARVNCGSLGYPVSIGVCLAGFSLFSLLVLKEKVSFLSRLGLCSVCIGIVTITLR